MPSDFIVALVDDDDAVRQSTAVLLKRAGHDVRSFTDGAAFLAADTPENLGCILLDMRMPGMDGLSVMRALKKRGMKRPIVVLTGHGDVPMAVEAMKLGAVDFLEKPYNPVALITAIQRACTTAVNEDGDSLVDLQAKAKIDSLSDREREVLLGILKGQQNKVIAWDLGLSPRTVETYRAQLLEKLGVRGTAEAVRLALAAGMSPD